VCTLWLTCDHQQGFSQLAFVDHGLQDAGLHLGGKLGVPGMEMGGRPLVQPGRCLFRIYDDV
jgi:hypothetical protein